MSRSSPFARRTSLFAVALAACAAPPREPPRATQVASAAPSATAAPEPAPIAEPVASEPVKARPAELEAVSLGTFVHVLEVPVASLALGETRAAALGDDAWILERGAWTKHPFPERVRPKAGERDDGRIFFGRDDRPRIMGTRTRRDGPAQLYLRFRNGTWNEERGEIAKLRDPPVQGMFGVLGHADPEVVCKVSDDCIVKRRTGWKMMRAGPGSPRIELHAGVAWALQDDGVARLDDDRVWTPVRPPEPLREPGGVWGLAGEVWISEPKSARLHHLQGGAWTTIDAPLDAPRGMWGASRDDVWLAGATGLAHYDGARWSRVAGPKGPLAEVYGRGGEVWAAGERGVWVRSGRGGEKGEK